MRIKVKGKKNITEQIWFESFNDIKEIKSKADRVFVHANVLPLVKQAMLQHTQITDLSFDIVDLLNSFNATVRNEIRRAEREGTVCKFFTSEGLKNNKNLLDNFQKMYKEMYLQKNLDRTLPINEICSYIANDCFLLTVAYIEEKPCVYHSYIIGERNARLLHSCSEFRVEDNATKNAIGRSNKLLHLMDMEYLKSHDVRTYDWGGIANPEQPNGIDKFKMSFSGEIKSYYNINLNISLKAKLIDVLLKLLKR